MPDYVSYPAKARRRQEAAGMRLRFLARDLGIGTSAVALLGLLLTAGGQAAAAPHFDVVSVRPVPPGYRIHVASRGSPGPVYPGGKYINPQAVLAGLIVFAYPRFAARPLRVGLPAWAYTGGTRPFYSVKAEAAPNTAPSMKQMRLMMRSLLAKRFGLKFHIETRTMPVTFLIIGPHGIENIRPSAPGERYVAPRIALRGGGIEARATPLIDLANFISGWTHRPLINRTGMTGTYDMDVKPGFDEGRAPIDAVIDTLARLGLALKKGKAAVPVMVVDHVQRPTPN